MRLVFCVLLMVFGGWMFSCQTDGEPSFVDSSRPDSDASLKVKAWMEEAKKLEDSLAFDRALVMFEQIRQAYDAGEEDVRLEDWLEATVAMGEILETVRRWEELKTIAEELLARSEDEAYYKAFAHLFLGDYFISSAHANEKKAQEALAYAIQLSAPFPKEQQARIAPAFLGLGKLFRRQGKQDSAVWALDQSQSLFPLHPAPNVFEARMLIEKSFLLEVQSLEDSALRSAQQAQRLLSQELASHHPLIGGANYAMGIMYHRVYKTDSAKQALLRSLSILERSLGKNHVGMGISWLALGVVMDESIEIEEVKQCYAKAMDIFQNTSPIRYRELFRVQNNLGNVYLDEGQQDRAIHFYKQALTNYRSAGFQEPIILSILHNNLARSYHSLNQLDSSEFHSLQAIKTIEELGDPMHPVLGQQLFILGDIYNARGQWDQALNIYQRSLAINEIHDGPEGWGTLVVRSRIGEIYFELGNVQKGIKILEEVLSLQIKLMGENHINIAAMLSNLAKGYANIEITDRQIFALHRAIKIYEKNMTPEALSIGELYNNLGMAYGSQRDSSKAIFYLNKALKIYQKTIDESHPSMIMLIDNFGLFYKDFGSVEQSLPFHKRAISLYETYYPEGHANLGFSYNNLGNSYAFLQQYDSAIWAFQQVIHAEKKLSISFSRTNLVARMNMAGTYSRMNQPEKTLELLENNIEIIQPNFLPYYEIKSYAFKDLAHKHIEKKALLDSAVHYFKYVISQADSFRIKFQHGFTRGEKLASFVFPSIQGGIQIAHQTTSQKPDQSIQDALYFFEKNRALSLVDALRTTNALNMGGVPIELQDKERELSAFIQNYEQLIRQAREENKMIDSVSVTDWEQRLVDLSLSRDSLLRHLEEHYPNYYQLKYDASTISPAELQQTLLPDQHTALISYFQGDSGLYVLGFRKDRSALLKVSQDSLLGMQVETFLDLLKPNAPGANPSDFDSFKQVGHQLYQTLLQPILHELGKDSLSSLIIIPDGRLSYLPFEVLLTEPGDHKRYDELPYLIKDMQIQYAYSATLLQQYQEQEDKAPNSWAGFAPSYSKAGVWADAKALDRSYGSLRDALLPLIHNQPEVEGISKMTHGQAFVGAAASEEAFKAESHKHGILHLAMHALTNDEHPEASCLVFTEPESLDRHIEHALADSLGLVADSSLLEDGHLYTEEIYQLPLQADLVVLSGCNTGIGKWQRGEGLMSLARAFAYAGCPNLLTSLWQVDDAATRLLMERFYQHLSEGKGKAAALRQAKLDYLASGHLSHPSFWSGFVLIGDDDPVPIQRNNELIWLWLLLLIPILMLIWKKRMS